MTDQQSFFDNAVQSLSFLNVSPLGTEDHTGMQWSAGNVINNA
jgi:hypothetical protein